MPVRTSLSSSRSPSWSLETLVLPALAAVWIALTVPTALAAIPTVEVIVTPDAASPAYVTGSDWPEGYVALTFDDGPSPQYTRKVLDILKKHGVRANYFLVGQMAATYPEIVREVAQAGHVIGTHSQKHPNFSGMSVPASLKEIRQGIQSVTLALGEPIAPYFRFPYLASNEANRKAVAAEGLAAMGWNNLWEGSKFAPRDGHLAKGILVTHDTHAKILTDLPRILDQMERYGYTAVLMVPPKH